MHYLNVEINWKLPEKINAQLLVHSNESACRKSGCFGMDQVACLCVTKHLKYCVVDLLVPINIQLDDKKTTQNK